MLDLKNKKEIDPDSRLGNFPQTQWLAREGYDATAEVLYVEHTGKEIDYNPVVKMKLNIQPYDGSRFVTSTRETVVPKLAVPRVGDGLKIKYNPADPTQVLMV